MSSILIRPDRALVEAQRDKILNSAGFRGSRRRQELLGWAVRRAFDPDATPVKEHQIGIEVFDKSESWDPRVDPIVRVEFNRLRAKLREFYEGEGKDDPVLIDFPPRAYVPMFSLRPAPVTPESPVLPTPVRLDVIGAIHSTPKPVLPLPPVASEVSILAVRSGVWRTRSRVWTLSIAASAALALALAAAWHLYPRHSSEPTPVTLAVLPFADLSPDHQDDYLSDGFTDELRNRLAGSSGLRVIAHDSAYHFKGSHADLPQIGRVLGADSLIAGNILRRGNTVHVVAHLNRAKDGSQLWSSTWDREVGNIPQIQKEIADSVAAALRVSRTAPAAAGAMPVEPSEEAHEQYLRGAYEAAKLTPQSIENAIGSFGNAIKLAPRYAPSYAALGYVYLNRAGLRTVNVKGDMETAKSYLEQAVALDPATAGAMSNLAYINYVLDWNWPAAEAQFQQALRLAATSDSHEMYGFALMTRGRFAEANAHYRLAIDLDPLKKSIRLNFAIVLFEEGWGDEAAKQIKFCLDQDPNLFPANLLASYAGIYLHHPAETIAYLRKISEIAPPNPVVEGVTAAAYAEQGRTTEALALVRHIESGKMGPGYFRYHLAIVSALLGDADGVFRWLNESADAREQQVLYIKVEPLLAQYRGDPRMIALERRLGLLS